MSFLLLGLDSLIAGFAIGSIVNRRSRLPLAAMFGIADGIAFLIGAGAGWQISDGVSTVVQTGLLAALGVYLFVIATQAHRLSSGWPVWVLPFVLAIDNLTFGLFDGKSSSTLLSQAGQQALSSALMAGIGLTLALVIPRAVPTLRHRAPAMRFAGAGLVLASGLLLLVG